MIYGVETVPLPLPAPAPLAGARFDNTGGTAGITAASQTLINSPYFTASLWFRTSDSALWPPLVGLNNAAVVSQIKLGEVTQGDIGSILHGAGLNSTVEIGTDGLITDGQTTHLFISADLNHAINAKIINVAIDGTTQTFSYNNDASAGAFNLNWTNEFGLPNFSGSLAGCGVIDYADVWIAVGQYVPLSDLNKFRTTGGGSVDLGLDGSTPTGTPPTYFFHGGASTFGTNAGSGPTTSVVGSITDITL